MEGETEPLRTSAAQWNLAGDKQLLGVLQNIHERLVSRCQETNRRLGEMAAALDDAAVDLHNVNNKFMALSNTQFVESRVYDEDVEAAPPAGSAREPKVTADPTSEMEKIKLGLKVLESLHEPLHIMHGSDSDSDSEDEITRTVLKLKDPYAHRPLPYIIGSYAWQNKWHAGLVVEDSESDESVSRTRADSPDQYSDSEPDTAGNIQTDRAHAPERTVSTASSDMVSEAEGRSPPPPVKPSPSEVAAELARRLGAHAAQIPEPEMEYTPPPPAAKTVYRAEKPAASTIFSDEPPPLEHSYSDGDDYSQEEDDDIFAELNKNKPYAQNNKAQSRVTEDLFGGLRKTDSKKDGDIFSDFKEPSKSNQNSILFSDESEPELFAEQSQAKTTKQSVPQDTSTVKKPVGGISLFGNKGTESIGAAILKRNQKQSSSDEDTPSEETPSHKQQIKKEKDIFDDLFAKSEKEQRKVEKNVKAEKEVVKEVKNEKKVDLFSDNLFDDIDDIFTSNIPKVPIKEANKNQKSIFDDEDDLFTDVKVTENTKIKVKTSTNIQKSIFDSDDELFAENTDTKLTDSRNPNINTVKETKPTDSRNPNINTVTETKHIEITRNIFDDNSDSDIFSDVKEPVSIRNDPIDKLENSERYLDITDANDKKITEKMPYNTHDKIIKSGEKIQPKPPIPEKSIQHNENGDSIKTQLSIKIKNSKTHNLQVDEVHKKDIIDNTEENKTDVTNKSIAKSVFDDELQDDLFNVSSINKAKPVEKSKVTKSLFDNDSEEELFSNKCKERNSSEITVHEPKSKAVVDVSVTTNTITQDTINEDTKGTKMENTKPNKGFDDLISKSGKSKQDPQKNDVSNIVNEEEIDDLFTKSNIVETVVKTSKEETDSVVNEGNDDEWDDDLFKASTTKDITQTDVKPNVIKIKSMFDKTLEEELFISSKNNEQTKVSETKIEGKENTLKIQEECPITEEVEPKSPKLDNTNGNVLNTPQDSLFYHEPNVDIEKPPLYTEQNEPSFNKSDIFCDIISEPPEFEKPKEPKKSKNINALFDDDSDDEALFFKKSDPTLDEKPEYSSPTTENRLFDLFHDEPPALDIDFVQQSSKIPNINEVPKDQVDYNDDFVKPESLFTEKSPSIPESLKPEKEYFLETKANIPVAKDKSNGTESDSSKRVGKLKSMNFNINVNALLPGASPKKVKALEHAKEHTQSAADIRTIDTTIQEIEPKIVKSISFEGKPESQVLDNTLSKERVKIQVKRRPSTRRARKEAVRKSAIDFGDDSTDHSSSIDDASRTDNSENDIKPVMDTEYSTNSLNYDSILDVEDLKPDVIPASSSTFETSRSEIEPKVSEVKTKTVYILNDEDIFDIEPKSDTKQTLSTKVPYTTDDDLFRSKSVNSKSTDPSKLDITEGLAENITSNLGADETLFRNTKSNHLNIVDDDDDLFKTKNNTGISTLGKVYKESKSIDIDEESLFKPQHKDSRDIDKVKTTDNLNEVESTGFVKDTEEVKYEKEAIDKTNASTDQPKEVKKVSLFDLSDEENDLFNKNAKIVKKGIFDSDSDEELFNNKKGTALKETKDVKEKTVNVKVDVKASLFGDDDNDDLFAVKKTDDIAPLRARATAKGAASKTTEPAFEDPLSLLGDED